jgi:membrane protein DedA with SNARE-associated domain
VLTVVNTFFDWLKESSSSPWFYLIIFTVAVFDSVVPIVPSESLVIIGGVSAGSGSLSIAIEFDAAGA